MAISTGRILSHLGQFGTLFGTAKAEAFQGVVPRSGAVPAWVRARGARRGLPDSVADRTVCDSTAIAGTPDPAYLRIRDARLRNESPRQNAVIRRADNKS